MTPLQRDDVIKAQKVLKRVLPVTPLLPSRVLTDLLGMEVLLKCENVQRTGSFKARGAYWRIHRMSTEERKRGVVAASAGNHAQGVALAASTKGISATVVMPETVALPKLEATERYLGRGQVVKHGKTVADAIKHAENMAKEDDLVFIHPYDHEDVIAGQGTVGLEIAKQCPRVKTVVVPVGGGGLAAGIAVALAGHESAPKIVGVQAEACAAYKTSLARGMPVRIRRYRPTIADGIAVPIPGDIPFQIMLSHKVPVLTVSEETLYKALIMCLEQAKQLVEPAGVAAFGALLEHKDRFKFEPPVVVVLSGGNIDTLLLADLLRHGWPTAGRILTFKCRLPDQPGSLARLLHEVGKQGANLVDMTPHRVAPELPFHQADVHIQLETRGEEHRQELIKHLKEKGYKLDEVS